MSTISSASSIAFNPYSSGMSASRSAPESAPDKAPHSDTSARTRPNEAAAPVSQSESAASPLSQSDPSAQANDKRSPKEALQDPQSAESKQLETLKARDREVKTHEMAHVAAGGPYVQGGPSYTYQNGPDGQRYAVGGEVSISVSPIEGDPEATLEKMQVVQRAALAPAEPSSQDQQVAAQAAKQAANARAELSEQAFSAQRTEANTAENPNQADPANQNRASQHAISQYQQVADSAEQATEQRLLAVA